MTRIVSFCLIVALGLVSAQSNRINNGDQLVSSVITECADMGCVKTKVLTYLDTLLDMPTTDARDLKNLDAAIFKRLARVMKTHEFHLRLPEMMFGDTEIVYSPRTGLDFASPNPESESRGILKKKLLFPLLLLLKLKMKALMPIFVAIIGIKALKALVLSKLAIVLVVGFIIVQLCKKNGMAMPMSMMPMMPPVEPPTPAYGAPPAPTMAPVSSYEPGWEPTNGGGPYSRVWTSNDRESAQNIAYSAYYPSASSTSARPVS